MWSSALLTCLLSMALLAASASQAAIIEFETTLLAANENPPAASPGQGSASVTIDTVMRTMLVDTSFSGLLGTTLAAHIHCCAPPPTNAPVATQVPTFIGFPLGVTSGSYQKLFDMTDPASYNPTFIANHGGTVDAAFSALLVGMLEGESYFNVHTSRFTGGEIRGQLAVVPEPATALLLALALAGAGIARSRSKTH
jgi:hypothetical protein